MTGESARIALECRLRSIVAAEALIDPESCGLDGELTGSGVDSLSLLRAVARIESDLGVTIPDEEFGRIRSMRALLTVIESRLAGDEVAAAR